MATATDSQSVEPGNAHEPRPDNQDRRGGITPASLFVVLLIGFVLVKVQFVFILVLVSLVLATTLDRPVTLLEKRFLIPRGLAILGLYLAFFGILILGGVLIAPSVREQVDIFITDAPLRLTDLRASWQSSGNGLLNGTGQQLLGNAIAALDNPPPPQQETAVNVLSSVVTGVVGLFATLVITFYYLMERSFIRSVILNEMSPRMRHRVARIWDDAEAKVGGWLRGQLTLCLIIGLAAAVGYGIIGVPFWPVLGLWAGITEIIPVLGPWLGGIPAVVLALTVSNELALITAAIAIGIQLSENWVLVPRVMRGAVGLTPLTVFIAITVGAAFYGIIGTLLAIPIAAFVQVIVTTFLDERRDSKQPRPRGAIPAWRWMRVSSRDSDPRDGNGTDGPVPVPGPSLASSATGSRPPHTSTFTSANTRGDRRPPPPASAQPASSSAPSSDHPSTATASGRPASASSQSASTMPRVAPGPGTPGGSRPAQGPRWTPEQLRRSAAPESSDSDIEHDDPPAPANRPAIGPGDQ